MTTAAESMRAHYRSARPGRRALLARDERTYAAAMALDRRLRRAADAGSDGMWIGNEPAALAVDPYPAEDGARYALTGSTACEHQPDTGDCLACIVASWSTPR